MADVLKISAIKPPGPPVLAVPKPDKTEKGPTDMAQLRLELDQQLADFKGSTLQKLEFERSFWQQVIAAGDATIADRVAIETEVARATIAIHQEIRRDAIAMAEDAVTVAKAGSEERIRLSENAMAVAKKEAGEGSPEFLRAQKEMLEAVRERTDAEHRIAIDAARDSAALTREGTQARIDAEQYVADVIKALTPEDVKAYQDAIKQKLQAEKAFGIESVKLAEETAHKEAAATREGSAERVAVYDRLLADTSAHYQRIEILALTSTGDQQKIYENWLSVLGEMLTRQNTMEERAARERADKLRKEAERSASEIMRTQLDRLALTEKEEQIAYQAEITRINDLASKDIISQQEKIRLVLEVQRAEEAARESELRGEIAVLEAKRATLTELQKEGGEWDKLTRQIEKDQQEITLANIKAAEQSMTAWERSIREIIGQFNQLYNTMISGFTRALDQMLERKESFRRGLEQMWNSIALSAVNAFAKLILEQIKYQAESLLLDALFGKKKQATVLADGTQAVSAEILKWTGLNAATTAGETAQQTITQTAAAASAAKSAGADTAQVAQEASLAGAAAFASVIEALPFPENVATAPGVAAGVAATVASIGASAAAGAFAGGLAAEGAMLSQDTLIGAHAGEAILPASLTAKVVSSFPALSLPSHMTEGISGLADSALNASRIGATVGERAGSGMEAVGAAVASGGAGGVGGPGGPGGAASPTSVTNINHGPVRVNLSGATRGDMVDIIHQELVPALRMLSRRGELAGLMRPGL